MQHCKWFIGLFLGLAGLVSQPLAYAEQPWIFAISEGSSGNIDTAAIATKYDPLLKLMKAATNREITLVVAREFTRLEQDMKNNRYDFVMVRASSYPARAVRDYGYKIVTSTKPDGRCYIIVAEDSPFKSLKEVSNKRFTFPELTSYATKLCLAELRDQGITVNMATNQYMREQDGIGFVIEKKLAEVGAVVSYSAIASNWEKKGGKILHKSAPQIYFPMIASSRIPQAEIAKIQEALLQLDKTEAGLKLLSDLRIKGFNVEDDKRLLALLKWLE